jgi:hypothetical protein
MGYTRAEVLAAVDVVQPGIELPDSRFVHFEKAGEAQLIADCACSNDMVLVLRPSPSSPVCRYMLISAGWARCRCGSPEGAGCARPCKKHCTAGSQTISGKPVRRSCGRCDPASRPCRAHRAETSSRLCRLLPKCHWLPFLI